jgi:hypothetical protein
MTSEANILNKRGCSIVIISLQGEKDINWTHEAKSMHIKINGPLI